MSRVYEDEDGRRRKHERSELIAWGEFYLQNAEWIPFDPMELQSSARGKPVDVPWRGFGSVNLNDRVPLTYDFAVSGMPLVEITISSRATSTPPALSSLCYGKTQGLACLITSSSSTVTLNCGRAFNRASASRQLKSARQ